MGKLKDTLRQSGFLWTASLVLDRVGIPAFRLWPDRKIMPETLSAQVTTVLREWGMTEDHIAITVRHMMYADLHGIDSHGSSMLLHYRRLLLSGSLTMTPQITTVNESETTALIDGGGGLGHVPADMAMKLAIEKCQAKGIGVVAVRNSGHYGAAGAYAALAAQSGLIGMATTNVRVPAVVPTFGVTAMLGTNPIAFAAPADRNRPFLLDMATATVPVGKLVAAWRSGRRIPAGWALNDKGKPIKNPRRAVRHRRLTPLGANHKRGSHKGYGLATMVEILSAVLPGEYGEGGVGHFFLALDPEQFRAADAFKTDLDAMMDGLRSSRPRTTSQPVRVPGDPEYAAEAERCQDGIPVMRSVIEDIRTVCRASGVPFILDANA